MNLNFAKLRVLGLVASAVAAGYLWRAALDGDNELRRLLDNSPTASIATQTLTAPSPRAGPVRGGLAPDRLLTPQPERTGQPSAGPARPEARAPRAPSAPSGAGHHPATVPSTPPEAVNAPTDHASPAPPAGRSGPTGGNTGRSSPPGASTPAPPKPAPPKPAPPKPAPPKPAPPKPAPPKPAPPAPAPTPPTPAPPTPPSGGSERPGWGNGDGNHDHTGPPGQAKK